MQSRGAMMCGALCAALLAGCGGSHSSTTASTTSATTTAATTTAATTTAATTTAATTTAATTATANTTTAAATPAKPPAGILGRVLTNNELSGFAAAPATVNTGARSWLTGEQDPPAQMDADYATLTRLHFIRGALENVAMGSTPGLSKVEQFHSADAARSELAAQTAEFKRNEASEGNYTPFAVPGIPSARGFGLLASGQGGINIAFVKGPYYYLVGQELAPSESTKAGTANLVAAAQHLYNRVSG